MRLLHLLFRKPLRDRRQGLITPGYAKTGRPWALMLFMAVFSFRVYAQETSQPQQNDLIPNQEISGIDSLRQQADLTKIFTTSDSIDDANPLTKADSILAAKRTELERTTQKLTNTVDSLTRLKLPTDEFTKKLDSLRHLSTPQVDELKSTIGKRSDRLSQPVEEVQHKLNEKLDLMRSEGGSAANLPDNINLAPTDPSGAMNIPGGDLTIDGDTDAGLGGMPDVALPDMPAMDSNLGGLDEIKSKIAPISETGSKLNDVTSSVSSATELAGQMEDVPGVIEQRLTETDQVQAIQSEITKADGALEISSIPQSPQQLQQVATQKVYAAAINHFSGKEKVLNEAIEQLNKLKAKYPHLSTVKDNMPRKMKNAMYGKSFVERLVPGIGFQIQRADVYIIDYNPNVAYRFTGRFRAGAGWNERYSIDHFTPSLNMRIFGPRVFSEFKVFKGFSARLDVETMNVFVIHPPNPVVADTPYRTWVWSAFVGIKKEYQFVKRVKGNFQLMYSLYDDDYSPYLQRLNVRFGFDMHLKKKSADKE